MIVQKEKPVLCWLPPLYFAQGLPAVIIAEVSILLFKKFGMIDSSVAFWSNFLGLLPLLLIKIFCAPVVDSVSRRRTWIFAGQLTLAILFLLSAFACKLSNPIPWLILTFFVASLTSGLHDIAADGFYILALDDHRQAVYSGLRSVFNRIAAVVGSGGFIILAGKLLKSGQVSVGTAWAITLASAAVCIFLFALWSGIFMPRPESDRPKPLCVRKFLDDYQNVFLSFFQKKHVWIALLFLLLYRLGEAQLSVMSRLFLLDENGLGLTEEQYGSMVGVAGVSMMLAGGVIAGILCGRFGLGKMLLPMVLAINLPDLLYVLLAFWKGAVPLWLSGSCVAVEQFGYGFGFAGYMLFMVWFASTSKDEHKTSHFALMTVFMIIGLRLPGMPSGWIAEHITDWIPCGWTKYQLFFLWVMVCTLPGFIVTWFAGKIIDRNYGIKSR